VSYSIVKRLIDMLVSATVLLLLSPFWLLLAILIKLDSPGPVSFSQPAIGLNGSPFILHKFRTMRPGSAKRDMERLVERNFRFGEATGVDEKGPIYKTALSEPDRITRVGRFLRRTSLDEVLQFWNVLKGDMSLVGPRPALPYEARLYEDWQKQRFSVRPGLTGLYQVTARHRVPIEQMIRIDLQYIEQRSLWLDLTIIMKTPVAMLSGL
jgi:lipopolysaccharide/colanic/teichoic acid biosynthesis glycosyltransferase